MSTATVLLIDCGERPMELLAARIRRLGYSALRVKTPSDAYVAISNARLGIGAAVLPQDAPLADPAGAIARLREVSAEPTLSMLVTGPRPPRADREMFQAAGIDHAIWEPMDAHALRFQLNRAMAWRHSKPERRSERAPFTWTAQLRSGNRAKQGRVYAASCSGLFIALPAPWLRGTELRMELDLGDGERLRALGRVAMTNVRGNLMKTRLPVGMGVRLEKLRGDDEARLSTAVMERLRELAVRA